MKYDFATLSADDFEDLTRDLVGREFGIRFEAFTAGTDDGMDGRHAMADGATILQAKHYLRSGFSKLKSKMKEERQSIDQLAPQRYVLATSVALTPANKDALAEIIGPALKSTGDIYGADDLNASLRAHPDIETAHQKLWVQSTPVLEKVLTSVVRKAMAPVAVPPALARLLPSTPPGDPGLTKINYNFCDFNDGLPVTVRFARMVGDVLTMGSAAKGEKKQPFKFYI